LSNKKGFTLAEVLLTLTIVGVIGALTIPPLIQNVQDIQLKTAWRKSYGDIAEATMIMKSDYGGTLKNVFAGSTGMATKYGNYLSNTKYCASGVAGCWHPDFWYALGGASRPGGSFVGLILTDGRLALFGWTTSDCSGSQGDSENSCGTVTIDVNGFKKPNTIGKDIFRIHITENPGHIVAFPETWNGCIPSSNGIDSGWGCSSEYLYNP